MAVACLSDSCHFRDFLLSFSLCMFLVLQFKIRCLRPQLFFMFYLRQYFSKKIISPTLILGLYTCILVELEYRTKLVSHDLDLWGNN